MFAAEYAPAERPVRRGRRHSVTVEAPVEQSGMARTLCKVIDLSLHGCRLLTFSAMARNESIWLNIPGLGVVAAIVVWADDLVAGCQFLSPLTDETFESLAMRYGLPH
ncbi:PilZ domain-containing protein [Sphingomonas sp. DT-51]|uniref:PilZ domain-containing protein n=1 Tax=Sphingomonas sp. DT-51 TaxID=3396165 RepID=UPI003F1ADE29